MTYNAASRKDIRKAEKAAKILDIQQAEVLVELMSRSNGRKFLYELLGRSHIFSTSVFSTDPIAIAFLEGERNLGIRLFNDLITHCPESLVEMLQEANATNLAKETTDVERGPDESEPGSEPDSEES